MRTARAPKFACRVGGKYRSRAEADCSGQEVCLGDGGGTAIQITDCSKDVYDGQDDPGVFGCDDDGGENFDFIIDGCLPAGKSLAEATAPERSPGRGIGPGKY